ncbi:MAG: macro domain-containing protein [Candidatus Riflebacteria bacterium]|nr:macro domain-containing protein [Candidatus Riflebacteria bacterium]
MIRYTKGNIFESKAQTLVNTVNCVGVMGKGLAKEFKDRFPEMNRQYVAACRRGEVRSGRPFIYRDLTRVILCFPTKDNWKGSSKYEFIEAGLKAVAANYSSWDIRSMAIPPLGCGLGGLDWVLVRRLIEKYLGALPIEIEVFEPGPAGVKISKPLRRKVIQRVRMTDSLALIGELIMLARRKMPISQPLGRLLVQKLAYFAQSAGAPLRLRFDKQKFGPYDHNVNHLIERLEGLYIRDVSTTYEKSNLQILDMDAWQQDVSSCRELLEHSRKSLERAVQILAGASLHEAELLATVLYAWNALVCSGELGAEKEVIDFIQHWSPEKKDKFTEADVIQALESLDADGWLGPREDEADCGTPATLTAGGLLFP